MNSRSELGTDALAFVEEIGKLDSVNQVGAALRRAIEPLGLTASSCGVVSGPRLAAGRRFHFIDWPPDFLGQYHEENFVEIDPVPRWVVATGRAASFSDIMETLPVRDPGRRVAEAARDYRLTEGILTPIRLGDDSLGVVSMAGERDGFASHERAYLQIVSAAALLRAAALEDRAGPSAIGLRITRRELDCLGLLARGLKDRDIARQMSIAEPTVRFHLDRARRKTGAISRTHLAALAIWLGLARL